jgi:hypothetical protein
MRRLISGNALLRSALTGLLLAATAALAAADSAQAPKLRLSALAVNLSGIGRVGQQRIEIVIDRWSTDAEHEKLLEILKEKGSDKLLDALQAVRPRVGYIRTATSLGWDIQYAREHPLPDGGRRIVFATDRPMGFVELKNRTRSSEYEFMLCEVHFARDGLGEGKLATLAKISYDKAKNQIEIENFGLEPTRLNRVEVEK